MNHNGPLQGKRYFDSTYNKKILIFGPPLPPPYGGVSVHIERVSEQFRQQNNHVVHYTAVCEYRYRWLLLYLAHVMVSLLRIRPDVIYYHTLYVTNCYAELRLLVFLKNWLCYELLTVDHNSLYDGSGVIRAKEKFNTYIVPHLTTHIIIGEHAYKQHCTKGIAHAQKIILDQAFLPPIIKSTHEHLYPKTLSIFITKHDFIMVSAITHVALRNGKDVYGLDFSIELIKNLVNSHTHIGLICSVGTIYDAAYYALICDRIGSYGLESSVFLVVGSQPLYPLFKHTNLFLRPTLTDGGICISEDEAHYFGVPVVASDVCLRHPKTIIYRSGSVEDCSIKVSEVLYRDIKAASALQRHSVHPQSP